MSESTEDFKPPDYVSMSAARDRPFQLELWRRQATGMVAKKTITLAPR